MTMVIMLGIVIVLASIILMEISYNQQNNRFFDKENTNAMRGFWSLINTGSYTGCISKPNSRYVR